MRVKINVTQSDIDRGCRREGNNCPVWRAIQPLLNFECSVRYGRVTFQASFKLIVVLPFKVTRTIQHYDFTGHMLPFSFMLDIPDEYLAEPAAASRDASLRMSATEMVARMQAALPDGPMEEMAMTDCEGGQ